MVLLASCPLPPIPSWYFFFSCPPTHPHMKQNKKHSTAQHSTSVENAVRNVWKNMTRKFRFSTWNTFHTTKAQDYNKEQGSTTCWLQLAQPTSHMLHDRTIWNNCFKFNKNATHVLETINNMLVTVGTANLSHVVRWIEKLLLKGVQAFIVLNI